MKIGIDVSPLNSGNYLSHRVRGTGFYLTHLKESLLKYYPDNEYLFFSRGENLPKADVIHYPYFEPFFITLPVFFSKKYVVTVHDLTPFVFPEHFPSGFKGRIKWQIQKKALRKASRVVTDSQSSKKDIIKYTGIPESKIDVVYLAAGEEFRVVDHESPTIHNLKRKYGLPEKFALYVGDVTWNKNLPRLVEAIKKTNIPLVLAGKALLSEDFDNENPWNVDLAKVQEETKNNKQFIKLGFVSQEDLVALYNLASVFVMPSIYEGFGLPILEAMACGCPVVISKNGSIPEVAGEAAVYVDADNAESISEGITKVIKDEKLSKKLSEAGLTQAKKFSWQKVAGDTIKTYQQA